MQTISSIPASAASMMASAANGGGTKIIVALAPVCCRASATVLKTGRPFVRGSAFAWRDTAHNVGPVGLALQGVKRAFTARDALHNQSRILVN